VGSDSATSPLLSTCTVPRSQEEGFQGGIFQNEAIRLLPSRQAMVLPYWTISHFSICILARRGHDRVRTSPTPSCTTSSRLTTSKAEQFHHGPDYSIACCSRLARQSGARSCPDRSWSVRRLGSVMCSLSFVSKIYHGVGLAFLPWIYLRLLFYPHWILWPYVSLERVTTQPASIV
jgi:hypothetical protein